MSDENGFGSNDSGSASLDVTRIAAEAAGISPSSGSSASGEGAPAAPAPYAPPPLPKSWKQEMEPHWQKLPKELHEYVNSREADVSRGIQMYRDGHDSWGKLLNPFKTVFDQHPGVNPHELFGNLMQSHLALTFGDAATKRALLQKLAESYQIDGLGGGGEAASSGAPAQPSFEQQVQPLISRLSKLEEKIQHTNLVETSKLVEGFFNDPKNEFAKELEDDILQQVKRGERDLSKAYEAAMWLNPKVREKVIAKRGAPASSQLNLVTGNERTPAPRKGSIDDTINEVVAKAFKTG